MNTGEQGRKTPRRGEWAALTFLVLPRALREEQLVLLTREVGWEELIHEGAGREGKADWQTELRLHSVTPLFTAVLSSPLTAAPTGRCDCAHVTHVVTEALRG